MKTLADVDKSLLEARDYSGKTPLHQAAANGRKQAVEYLLSRRCDPKVKDSTGKTPLHYAAMNGHKDIAEILILRGALVNVRDSTPDQWTPLGLALKEKHEALAAMLLVYGGQQ
ncbi:MAG: ankyrin repeat domain-containing protein [Candidatus Eremiobacteraeota bacterium]|nr:ankyrin repeat domain-containing protein [Candidatus Eremiobacteraeota bacterium]